MKEKNTGGGMGRREGYKRKKRGEIKLTSKILGRKKKSGRINTPVRFRVGGQLANNLRLMRIV